MVAHVAHDGDLVLRHQVGEDLVDAHRGGDALGHALVVAGQHDHALDAGGLQVGHDGGGVGSQRVGQANDAQVARGHPLGHLGHDNARLPFFLQLVDGGRHRL